MPQQNQQTSQQNKQQSRGIFGSSPGTTHDHGSEVRVKRPVQMEDLTPPSRACFPGEHDGVSVEG
jgi:hypothetical protein